MDLGDPLPPTGGNDDFGSEFQTFEGLDLFGGDIGGMGDLTAGLGDFFDPSDLVDVVPSSPKAVHKAPVAPVVPVWVGRADWCKQQEVECPPKGSWMPAPLVSSVVTQLEEAGLYQSGGTPYYEAAMRMRRDPSVQIPLYDRVRMKKPVVPDHPEVMSFFTDADGQAILADESPSPTPAPLTDATEVKKERVFKRRGDHEALGSGGITHNPYLLRSRPKTLINPQGETTGRIASVRTGLMVEACYDALHDLARVHSDMQQAQDDLAAIRYGL
ncbi:hypothetical protein KIPB_007704 [Kipferlia bialata]|uniref:Uncharacterized protein n=1 Tax=Kipferlia bialata TaxID=797122 RepID=A0A9K3D1M0_9EUKA|nr:hypothetical protein KIPB_007704 [Kipferlia bialata]|eukprot:g7704.t1